MLYDNPNEVVNERFDSFLLRYLIALETSMGGNDFIFDSIQLLCYKFHQIDFKQCGSGVDSPDWIKK